MREIFNCGVCIWLLFWIINNEHESLRYVRVWFPSHCLTPRSWWQRWCPCSVRSFFQASRAVHHVVCPQRPTHHIQWVVLLVACPQRPNPSYLADGPSCCLSPKAQPVISTGQSLCTTLDVPPQDHRIHGT